MSVNDTSRIVIGNTRVMLQTVASLNDDSRGIIYNHYMFIVQATGPQGHRATGPQGHWATGPQGHRAPMTGKGSYGHRET